VTTLPYAPNCNLWKLMVDGKVVYADTQFFTETFDFVYVKLVGHSVSDDSGQKSALNNLLLVWKGNLKLLIVI